MFDQPRAFARALGFVIVGLLGASCSNVGKYGYARTYEPLLTEKGPMLEAQDLPYEQVKRAPYDYKQTLITWFGVVTKVSTLPDGRMQLKLSVRAHQARHLCRDEFANSCRVTVSESSAGDFIARITSSKADREGPERIMVGSLLKIYGRPTGDFDDRGDPVVEASYHRHWPRGYYVTTALRGAMKR